MRSLARALFVLLAFTLLSVDAPAQTSERAGTGVISGHIAVGDKPAQGVVVIVVPSEPRPDRREIARAVTDYEGNYRLMGLPAGRFSITPLAPTLVAPADATYGGAGRFVILGEGETVEKIDFSMTRAGVITGRVTDADGKPVIEERVQLTPADTLSRSRLGVYSNPYMYQTDDRGVYRLYGIPPGRYTLSVGVSAEESMVRAGNIRRTYYPRTYYPGETDIKKAALVEVTEGGEVRDVNIKLGRQSQAFSFAGRVVDAETGRPVPSMLIGYGSYDPKQKVMSGYSYGQHRTNARGEFRVEGVMPGRFAAFVWSENESYSDPVPFEVTDADVTGIEIKLKRGATITGVIQFEGTTDKRLLPSLSKIMLGASVQTAGLGPPENRQATLEPDGSFRLTGLPPGRAQLFMFDPQAQKNIRLLRLEHNGVSQPNGIEITPGAQITDVRVVFEYGNSSIVGQVRFENGTMPEAARIFVSIHKAGEDDNSPPVTYSQADARGRFVIDGLVAGDYQVIVRAQLPSPGLPGGKLITGRQSVTVSNGVETEATVVLDLAEGKQQ